MTTIRIGDMDPINNIEAGYSNYELLSMNGITTNNESHNSNPPAHTVWSRLSRVIYSIFVWTPDNKHYYTYPNDNKV